MTPVRFLLGLLADVLIGLGAVFLVTGTALCLVTRSWSHDGVMNLVVGAVVAAVGVIGHIYVRHCP
jgi:hypothetical protein